ncbi:hypothetical protein FRC0522_00699 [Corynebacterium diphtheriae]|nr:hypothetical protein FRC0522_00699 [Corynebacterium diphtheriae]
MKQPVVSACGLTFSYPDQEVLHNVDVDIFPGEVIALLG